MESLNFNKGAHPLYFQIKQILKEKIESGQYNIGEVLPSENELQEIFNVSRITVRQALNELVLEGYLSRKRGKGTIVIPHKFEEKLSVIKSFTEEMSERGFKPVTFFAEIKKVNASKKVANVLSIKEGDPVFNIRRVRGIDDDPIVFFNTYLTMEVNLPLDNQKYYDSLYKLIQETSDIRIVKAYEYIEATIASKELGELLDVDKCSPILRAIRYGYNQNDKIIELSELNYRADKYRYVAILK